MYNLFFEKLSSWYTGVIFFLNLFDYFQNLNGGTTVSATMLLAHKAGIPIFVTGGIGGVHRGAESSKEFDFIYYFYFY